MAKKKKKKGGKAKADPAPAPPKKNRANVITAIAILTVLVGGVVVVFAIQASSGKQAPIVDGGKTALCASITTTDMKDRNHIDPTPTQYAQDPPVGGNHWASPPPLNDGYYETVLPHESLVHNLEHGQIVVYYPQGDKETAAKVKAFINEQGSFIVAVPRANPLPDGAKVAYTAWGHSQLCQGFDKAALTTFQDTYKNKGPEKVR